jgi:hypothetical protein
MPDVGLLSSWCAELGPRAAGCGVWASGAGGARASNCLTTVPVVLARRSFLVQQTGKDSQIKGRERRAVCADNNRRPATVLHWPYQMRVWVGSGGAAMRKVFMALAVVGIGAEKTHMGRNPDGTYDLEASFETQLPGYQNSETLVQPIVLTARPSQQPVPGMEPTGDMQIQYNGTFLPTPAQTEPMPECATGSNGCDTATTVCKVFVPSAGEPLAVCDCLEGYVADRNDLKACVASTSPTSQPTHAPTKLPCVEGTHCCDTETSVCQEDLSLHPGYYCLCLSGFVDPSPKALGHGTRQLMEQSGAAVYYAANAADVHSYVHKPKQAHRFERPDNSTTLRLAQAFAPGHKVEHNGTSMGINDTSVESVHELGNNDHREKNRIPYVDEETCTPPNTCVAAAAPAFHLALSPTRYMPPSPMTPAPVGYVPPTHEPTTAVPTLAPTHLPTGIPCAESKAVCDTETTMSVFREGDGVSIRGIGTACMCQCLEGFLNRPDDQTSCIASGMPTSTPSAAPSQTPSFAPTTLMPTIQPTHMPTFQWCDEDNDCDPHTALAVLNQSGEGCWCQCFEGFIALNKTSCIGTTAPTSVPTSDPTEVPSSVPTSLSPTVSPTHMPTNGLCGGDIYSYICDSYTTIPLRQGRACICQCLEGLVPDLNDETRCIVTGHPTALPTTLPSKVPTHAATTLIPTLTPTHMPTFMHCDQLMYCDTETSVAVHEVGHTETTHSGALAVAENCTCQCLEGFVVDPASLFSCSATSAPTGAPTFEANGTNWKGSDPPSSSPPGPPCNNKNHGCDLETTFPMKVEEVDWLIVADRDSERCKCVCLEGFGAIQANDKACELIPAADDPTGEPTHMPTGVPCADESDCDMYTTMAVQADDGCVCQCLEGYVTDTTDETHCLSTSNPTAIPTAIPTTDPTQEPTWEEPTQEPTHMPTGVPCGDDVDHGCDPTSTLAVIAPTNVRHSRIVCSQFSHCRLTIPATHSPFPHYPTQCKHRARNI